MLGRYTTPPLCRRTQGRQPTALGKVQYSTTFLTLSSRVDLPALRLYTRRQEAAARPLACPPGCRTGPSALLKEIAKVKQVRRAVVVGTGLMGPGIAYTLASAGVMVAIYGRTEASAERGMRSVNAAVAALVDGRCLSHADGDAILSRVQLTTDLQSAGEADLVTESIVEDAKTKQDLFVRLEGICRPDTLLTSNTSGIPASLLAGALQHPERFAVTHYWNPPHLMPLVEVVRGERTAPETIDTLVDLLRTAGKKPVVVQKDTPGQLGNRLYHALIREAIYIVQEGIASAEDVDTAFKFGLGRRAPVWGVLQHQDYVGLDMVLAIQSYMCKALCNDTEPARILREKVAAGELGRKTGRGFLDWHQPEVVEGVQKRDAFLIERLRAEAEGRV